MPGQTTHALLRTHSRAASGGSFVIAIDNLGNVWTANEGFSSLSEFSNDGVAISPTSGYVGGGLAIPRGIAIDGSDNVWVVNNLGTLSKFFDAVALPFHHRAATEEAG